MPEPAAAEPPPDPSMEDILASIRRILDEDPAAATPAAETADELLLDESMRAPEPAASTPAAFSAAPVIPIAPEEMPPLLGEPVAALLEPATADQATDAIRPLARLALERGTQVAAGGPTLEDLVREELRPLLKTWLDAHLPPLIERVVRGEIERLVHRAER